LRGCDQEKMMPRLLDAIEEMQKRGAAVCAALHEVDQLSKLKDRLGDQAVTFLQSEYDASGKPTFSFHEVPNPISYEGAIFYAAERYGWPYPLPRQALSAA
jgi:hypothetical protein